MYTSRFGSTRVYYIFIYIFFFFSLAPFLFSLFFVNSHDLSSRQSLARTEHVCYSLSFFFLSFVLSFELNYFKANSLFFPRTRLSLHPSSFFLPSFLLYFPIDFPSSLRWGRTRKHTLALSQVPIHAHTQTRNHAHAHTHAYTYIHALNTSRDHVRC